MGELGKKEEPEYKKVKRSLSVSIVEGSFSATMNGIATPFMSAYALYLGASNVAISFLASFPDLSASFFQLLALKVAEIFKSKKKILVAGAFFQALIWLPLLLVPLIFQKQNQALMLILLYSCIIMIDVFLSPFWRTLMGDLVSESERGTYFSRRNKITAGVNFGATMLAGFILQIFSKSDPYYGFAILFTIALIARLIASILFSAMYEKKTHDPNEHHYPEYKYTLFRFIKDLNKTDYGKFILFICLFKIAVNIAGPFMVVYELKHLGFTYFQYTILIAIELISSILFMGLWGRLNDDKGSKTVMLISGLLIPFIPFLYLFSSKYSFFIIVAFFSGATWAGFNLAVGNFMFDASSPHERVRYTVYYNLFNGVSIFIGAMIGGFLMSRLPDIPASFLTVFAISFAARLAVAISMLPKLHEMRLVELKFGKSMFQYPLIVKPKQRFVQDPFDYYLAYPTKPKKTRPRLYVDESLIAEPEDAEKQRLEQIKLKKFMERYGPKK